MSGIFLLIFAGWYLMDWKKEKDPRRLWPVSLLDTGELLLTGIFFQYAADLLILAARVTVPLLYSRYYELLQLRGNLEVSVATFLSTVIFAPLLEEFIFRGILFRKCCTHFPLWICNLVQAALFGVCHRNMLQGLLTFLLGLFLGYIAAHYDSVFPAVLVHVVLNLCGWLNLALSVTVLQKTLLAAGTGAVILAACGRRQKNPEHQQ